MLMLMMLLGLVCVPDRNKNSTHTVVETTESSIGCFLDTKNGTKIVLLPGEAVSVPGDCSKATCEEDFDISYLTCPTFVMKPGCTQVETNYSIPYPQCCPYAAC